MPETISPTIDYQMVSEDCGRFVIEPLEPGYGLTLGNAMRRVLLSSLNGAAVTAVKIDGIQHEFSTIPHMKEDTMEFLLNLKGIRFRHTADHCTGAGKSERSALESRLHSDVKQSIRGESR